jgi:hypothetical protein
MGVVYLGVDPAGRWVAVKVVRDEYAADRDFRRRFDREVSAAAAVDSPRVATVVDADPGGDVPWLATEYVHGIDCASAVANQGPLPAGELQALAAGLAEALCAIHDAGVVHRDIKPGNVVLGADGPKVVDFGVAAAGRTRLTQTGVVLGSLGYMAPEQVTGEPQPGPPADVFSWGLTVAYAGTARAPFGDGPAETVLFRTVYGWPDLTGLPHALRRFVSRSVSREPDRRPTARELVRALTAVGAAVPPTESESETVGVAQTCDLVGVPTVSAPVVGVDTVAGTPASWALEPVTGVPPGANADRRIVGQPTDADGLAEGQGRFQRLIAAPRLRLALAAASLVVVGCAVVGAVVGPGRLVTQAAPAVTASAPASGAVVATPSLPSDAGTEQAVAVAVTASGSPPTVPLAALAQQSVPASPEDCRPGVGWGRPVGVGCGDPPGAAPPRSSTAGSSTDEGSHGGNLSGGNLSRGGDE